MKWNIDSDKEIIKLIKEGKNYKEIAILFDTTYDSIRGRCFQLNIKSSDYKNPEKTKTFNCINCNKDITDSRNRKFCSQSCSATYNNKLRKPRKKKTYGLCFCGEEIKKGNKKCCSIECRQKNSFQLYIEKWKNGEVDGMRGQEGISNHIRKYIFEKYNNKCVECDWSVVNKHTNLIPLEIDHIDGDYKNNNENNLRLLCKNCHSLTETYGSRNRGNGRSARQKKRKMR